MSTIESHSSAGMMGAEGFGSASTRSPSPGSYSKGSLRERASNLVGGPKVTKDRKQILEIGEPKQKLKEMRKVIEEMAQGEDRSDLFPMVVKNVVAKSVELRKLVYQYVVRYAEELPDIALLSISSFQKGLKDPNQLIRASALRVLSSIRVDVIIPIVQIAVNQAAVDMSPYVRKCAAHALPKLYNLDPDGESIDQESLIEVLDKLLMDRTSLVLGSTIMAFEEICPDRYDLIHKHFRKLCNTLIDVDEWGQIIILKMLGRYARVNFLDPKDAEDAVGGYDDENFYGSPEGDEDDDDDDDEDDDEDEESQNDEGENKKKKKAPRMMDPDHRLLLRSAQSLLTSRNSGVIMAVVQIYECCAPTNELGIIVKPLTRLMRGHREIQNVALITIASLVSIESRRIAFEPFIKSFFIRGDDPGFIRAIKLEILTCLASDSTIGIILREFQTYVLDSNKQFACQAIQCIGRVAAKLEHVTDQCLSGLMVLLQSTSEAVVAEAVVVIKRLLQQNPESHRDIIERMSRLAVTIQVPAARASILWLLGEYSALVPKIAPDVLRELAKTFGEEEDIVKLQILNLAAKLYLTNQKQTKLLLKYVLDLAKYDLNYDLRDRARYVRAILHIKDTKLHKHAKHLFLSTKPAPEFQSMYEAHHRFPSGTLSHMLNEQVSGYIAMPEWTTEPSDPQLRNYEQKVYEGISSDSFSAGDIAPAASLLGGGDDTHFYSDDDTDSDDSDSDSDDSSDSSSGEGEDDGSGSDDSDSDSDDSDDSDDEPESEYGGSTTEESSDDDDDGDSGSDDDSDSDDDSEESGDSDSPSQS